MTKNDRGPIRKMSSIMWAYTNYGIVQGVRHTRREAIKAAEENCGDPWSKAKRYMEIRKVLLKEIA